MTPFGIGPGLIRLQAPLISTPTVSGYSLWLDATYSGNTNSTWVDQSGNNYNTTVLSGSDPVLTAGNIGGKTAYVFSTAASTAMATPSYSTGVSDITAVAVFRSDDLTSLGSSPLDANYSTGPYAFAYGTNIGVYFWREGSHTPNQTPDNNPHIMMIVVSGTTVTGYIDNVSVGSFTAATLIASLRRYVGYYQVYTHSLTGAVGEVVEWPFALTDAQRNSEYTRLSTKWGI